MLENNYLERYELAMERIRQIAFNAEVAPVYAQYFKRTAEFILMIDELYKDDKDKSLKELELINKRLYADIEGIAYEESFANPAYAVALLGELNGRLLSFVYTEIRGMIVYAYEDRLFDLTICAEMFVQIYCMFEADEEPNYRQLRECIYYFVSDYSDETLRYRIREQLDVNLTFATDIVMNSDLTDLRYLYSYGEYITDNEIKVAKYLNSLSEELIQSMADTYTEGFRIGFVLGNKDLSKKSIVNIRYCVGFERIVRAAIKNFEKLGLKPTIFRAAVNSINKKNSKIGYYSTSPNKQYEYDHRFDNALYIDRAFNERRLGVLRTSYEEFKVEASKFAGPAVMEVFGEVPFEPVNKKENYSLDDNLSKLNVAYAGDSARIVNEYIKGEERSFTIIAYPIPEIGDNFEEIFMETVKINTLDYDLFKGIQQAIIDVLDKADYVKILGTNGNKTNMQVKLMKLDDPDKQTKFENCLADVNIPVGEVFTSPVLAGTKGTLNVSEVYLHDLKYNNLTLEFEDGRVVAYSCDNFDSDEENKKFIKSNLLYNHDTLPIGEFAIGTNTTAYVMAHKYDIVHKLPILIVEKMGPHFAVGDTCYTYSEDITVYNPDGKEIVAKDNEITLLRKTNPKEAYFNCHTDITIPYDEIGLISAVMYDGSSVDIIRDGRFVLNGTEKLNDAF
ncbi:MAG: aminopeptidase [Lachnospiraceae bacterium]|nr:aminopeptidase [Lachnospiraceae bacterium]